MTDFLPTSLPPIKLNLGTPAAPAAVAPVAQKVAPATPPQPTAPAPAPAKTGTYSYADIGQRIIDRNPDAFKGLNVTPEQVGQRAAQRNPKLQELVGSPGQAETPAEPVLTPDQASAKATGAFFPANTENPSIAEPLKALPNMIPSAFNFVKGAIDMLNPVSTIKKIGEAGKEAFGLNQDVKAENEAKQLDVEQTNNLIDAYNRAKASGKDVSQTEALFQRMGIDPTKYATPAPAKTTLGAVAREVPKAAYESLVPEAGRALVSAGIGAVKGDQQQVAEGLATAQRDIINDPVGSILPFLLAAKGGAEALDRAGITKGSAKAFDSGVSKVGKAGQAAIGAVAKPAVYAFGKAAEGVKNTAGFASRQLTGLNAETTAEFAKDTSLKPVKAEGLITKREELGAQVQKALATQKEELGVTPASLGQEVQKALAKRVADIQETGSAYKPIRESKMPVKVDSNFLETTLKDTAGVDIIKGKVKTNAAAKVREATDVRALQHFYDTYQPLFQKGQMTPNEFLNMRSDLAKLSQFERQIGKSSDLEATAKIMRGKLNTSLRPQLEGLAELDETFSAQTGELKSLTKGLVDKNGNLSDAGLAKIAKATEKRPQLLSQLEQVSPGITKRIEAMRQFADLGKGLVDENGNITDTGMKKIANAANESNPQALARLEQIKPGITKAIKQYKALQDVVNASEKFKVGTYGRAIGQAGVLGGIMTMNPALIGGAIAEMILTNPENAIKIVQTYAKTKSIMSSVVKTLQDRVGGTLSEINNIPNDPSGSMKKLSERAQKVPIGMTIEDVTKNPGKYPQLNANEPQKAFTPPKYKNALEAMRSPEMQAKFARIKEMQKNARVTKTSHNLYHTTSVENLESIQKNGLTTGNKPRFAGVSSPGNISFSANEAGASYYGRTGDVMIRTKTSFKPKDLEHDLLAGGEGAYITKTNIPPEMLEIKQGKKWVDLKDYKKQGETIKLYHKSHDPNGIMHSEKGVFAKPKTDINTLGGKHVFEIEVSPKKLKIAENQYSLLEELGYTESQIETMMKAGDGYEQMDLTIAKDLKEKGYDAVRYTKPDVGRGDEYAILDKSIITKAKKSTSSKKTNFGK